MRREEKRRRLLSVIGARDFLKGFFVHFWTPFSERDGGKIRSGKRDEASFAVGKFGWLELFSLSLFLWGLEKKVFGEIYCVEVKGEKVSVRVEEDFFVSLAFARLLVRRC